MEQHDDDEMLGLPSPRNLNGQWVTALPIIGAALLLLALGFSNPPWGSAAAWAVCLLLALVGWGGVVERLLGDRAPAGWALRAIWGMAAVLAVGGPLAAFHIASKPVLLAQVIVGLFLAAYFAFVGKAQQGERRPRVYAKTVTPLVLVTSGFAIVHFVGYLGFNVFQLSDDQPLYFLLAEKLVQTGSFHEPFNVRRLVTYGGQSYLHALYLAVAPHDFLHVLDGGLGFAIVAGLLLGDLPARPSRADLERVWLAVTLLIALLSVRTNIGSLMTGCAVFIGIYQTLRRPWHYSGTTGLKSTTAGTVLIGVLVATAGLLRTSNAIPAAVFAALSLLPSVQELRSRETLRSALRAQMTLAVGALITLVPWLLLFRESCGTAIYPLQKGYLSPGFVILKINPSVFANLQSFLVHLFYERPVNNLPLFVLAALLPAVGNDRIVRAFSWSTLLGFCLIVYAGGGFSAYNNSRYYFGFVSGFALIMALTARRTQTGADMIPIGVRDVVIVIAVLANLMGGRAEVAQHYRSLLESAQRARRDAAIDARATEAKTRGYRDLQSHMEAGAKAVMMVDEPFRFDLRRNEMMSLDIGGGMGPSPGYPAFKGAEALGSYLVANGVRYVVYVDFAHSAQLYVRAAWQSHLIQAADPYLQGEAPYMLDAMRSIDALASSRAVVYSRNWMSVVDLRSQAPPAACTNPVLLSRGAPVTASNAKNVEAITDGNPNVIWNSEGFPPQWVEIDLGADSVMHHVTIIPEQTPAGYTEHRISGTTAAGQTRFLGELKGNAASGDPIVLTVPDDVGRGIRKVKVETVDTSRSWVAWREIEVYGCR